MSHAYGEVICGQEVVGHFEFNGTSGIVRNPVFEDRETVKARWRDWGEDRFAYCRHNPETWEEVLIYTDYGHDHYWPGAWCPLCRLITQGEDPGEYLPEADEEWEIKDGHPLRG